MIRHKSVSEYTDAAPAPRRPDPMSHRIIEKRRRDRMNNCLADLSRLIPAEYLKKGRGRVEKTEIIEMAIKHMQHLQTRANLAAGIDCSRTAEGPVAGLPGDLRITKCEQSPSPMSDRGDTEHRPAPPTPPPADPAMRPVVRPIVTEHYRLGYQECLSEAMHFLVEVEGYFAGDSLCVKLISHLQKHCDKIVKGDRLNVPRTRQPGEATSSSGSSSSYGAAGNGGGNGGSIADSGVASKGPLSSSPDETAVHPGHPHPYPHPHHGLAASHLRDILCSSPPSPQYHSPHLHPLSHPLGHHGLPQHYDSCTDTDAMDSHEPHEGDSHPGPHSPHSPHHHYTDPHHHHNSYKFKNTIKQRFSEEHDNAGGSGLLKRRRTMTRSPPPSPPSPATPSASHPSQPPGQHAQHAQHAVTSVPIFVLHAKGAFYIPLSVSYEVLAPYLDADLFSDAGSARGGVLAAGGCSSLAQVPPGVVLHPVTISVNFQQYVKPPPPAHTPQPPAVQAMCLSPHASLVPAPAPAHALVPPPRTTPTPPHASYGTHAHAPPPWARTDTRSFISPWEMSARQ